MKKTTIIKDDKTAVVAIVVLDKTVLLLKRTDIPFSWCPPCGRVKIGETLEEALFREVKEETGLDIEIVKFVNEWEGLHESEKIRSFTFICRTRSSKVILSNEHSDYVWVKIDDLQNWSDKTDFSLLNWPKWIANF